MSKKSTIISLMMVIVFLSIPMVAYADTYDTATATVTFTDCGRIWFHSDGDLNFTVDSVADYDYPGYTKDDPDSTLVVRWEANFDWSLYVSGGAEEPYFDYDANGTGGSDPSKDFDDIEFLNGTGWEPVPLSTTPYLFKSGPPGSFNPSNDTDYEQTLFFRVAIFWAEPAGIYTYEHVTFTLSAT